MRKTLTNSAEKFPTPVPPTDILEGLRRLSGTYCVVTVSGWFQGSD